MEVAKCLTLAEIPHEKTMSSFTCSQTTKVISLFLLDDLYEDCGESAEDELMLLFLLVNNTAYKCQDPSQVPCFPGHAKCFFLSDSCIYKRNPFMQLTPCRNGRHLENCRSFECNGMFKCPGFYCIPWELVCDQKWDCPRGKDESQFCLSFDCSDMYACAGQKRTCIHLANVCDGFVNCPLNDDEQLCDLKAFHCPRECQCHTYSLLCSSVRIHSHETMAMFHFIYLRNVSLLQSQDLLSERQTVLYLSIDNTKSNISCSYFFTTSLIAFNSKLNCFSSVEKACFKQSSNLTNLQLSSNKIEHVGSEAFSHLDVLTVLNLSSNLIKRIPKGFLVHTPKP